MEREAEIGSAPGGRPVEPDAHRPLLHRIEAFLEALPDEAWMKDADGRYVVVNERFVRTVGRTREELVGHTDAEVFGPEAAGFIEADRETLSTHRRNVREHWGAGLNDRDRRYETIRAPVREADGKVCGLVGISRDVTERSRREEQLRKAERHYRRLTETSPYGIFVTDPAGRIQEANAALCRILDRPPEVLQGRPFLEFVAPRSRPRILEVMDRKDPANTGPVDVRLWIVRPSGEERRVHSRSTTIHENGQPAGAHGVVRDITEEVRRKEAEQRMLEVLQATPDIVIIRDAAGALLYTNHPGFAEDPRGPAESRWNTILETMHPAWAAEKVREVGLPTALRDGTWTGEAAVLAPDGSEIPISQVILAGRDDDGRVTHFSTIMRDISAIRAREEELRQSQKMEAVGRLAGGVAHDFNNMLTAIQGFATVLRDEVEGSDEGRVYLDEILRAAERSAALTRQLLAFSRKQVMRPKLVDLNATVRGMETMLRRLLGETVQLATSLDPDLAPVTVDPGQIEQVIMNLAVNARDAMPDGGTLEIATRNVHVNGEAVVTHEGALPPGDWVMIAVRDSGFGLPAEIHHRVFEPFFTTKGAGEGTGLGLATVYGIVSQSGGDVALDSRPGEGATFRVYLPRSRPSETSPPPESGGERRSPASAAGRHTVAVVEDETAVRRLIERVLERQGYRVISASGGPEALDRIRAHEGPVHLLLSDVVMPEMSGPELAGILREERPGLPACFMSGYTEDEVFRRGVETRGQSFLEKPFTPAELRERVASLLNPTG